MENAKNAETKVSNSPNVIIDCDPGWDDALSLSILLNQSGCLSIKAIFSVFGNGSVIETTNNAKTIIESLARCDVPLFVGAGVSQRPPPKTPAWVFSKQGEILRNPSRECACVPQENAPDGLLHALSSNLPFSIIATGPLTNVAKWIATYPNILRKQLEKIIVFGGAIDRGNVNGNAEFNFYMDSKSANVVLTSEFPVLIVPLDLPVKYPAPQGFFDKVRSVKSHTANLFADIVFEYCRAFNARPENTNLYLYDLFAAMLYLREDLFQLKPVRCGVFDDLGPSHGKLFLEANESSNVCIAVDVSSDDFYDAALELLM